MTTPLIQMGTLQLGSRPAVAAIIDRTMPVAEVKGLAARGADLLEMRVDLIDPNVDAAMAYVREVRAAVRMPLLGTLRETPTNATVRTRVFEDLIDQVDAIDIEIDTPIRDYVIQMAAGKIVVVSEHDYNATPDDNRLREIAKTARDAGGHIVKIAATAHTAGDVTRLMRFCEDCGMPAVMISMGERGTISRVLAPLFGSLFTYAFVNDAAVAPGQLHLERVVEELGLFFPTRDMDVRTS